MRICLHHSVLRVRRNSRPNLFQCSRKEAPSHTWWRKKSLKPHKRPGRTKGAKKQFLVQDAFENWTGRTTRTKPNRTHNIALLSPIALLRTSHLLRIGKSLPLTASLSGQRRERKSLRKVHKQQTDEGSSGKKHFMVDLLLLHLVSD